MVSASRSAPASGIATRVFSGSVRSGTSVRVGAWLTLVTVHVKVWSADAVPSETDTVTVEVPALAYVRVPLITPVAGLIVTPGGSGAALYVSVVPVSRSVPASAIAISVFSGSVRSGTSVSVGGWLTLVTVHEKVWSADAVPSETDTVTVEVPALAYVSVPLIRPVAVFTVIPAGSGPALYVSVVPASRSAPASGIVTTVSSGSVRSGTSVSVGG